MEKESYPFYRFFQRLRLELGIELDTTQYSAFWEVVLSTPSPIDNWAALLDLCKILWLTKSEYEASFNQLFKEEVLALCKSLTGSNKENTSNITPPIVPTKPPASTEAKGTSSGDGSEAEVSNPQIPLAEESNQPLDKNVTLYLQFSDAEEDESGSPSPNQDLETEFLSNSYIFSDKYSALLDRRLQQKWKYLRSRNSIKKASNQLDIAATVQEKAKWRIINSPKYLVDRVSKPNILLLIDRSSSMVAFEYLEQHLIEALKVSLPKTKPHVAYFFNTLDSFYQKQGLGVQELLTRRREDKFTVIVLSDAGAARGSSNPTRIRIIRTFIQQVRSRGHSMIWLNPFPEERWSTSSAEYIAYFVDMLAISLKGLKSLPELLKRK